MNDEKSSAPLVSGISPREGPPGTKVTIRGENLGESQQDVIGLRVAGKDCLSSLEYHSSKKLVCKTGPSVGSGRIIVTTLSGGEGTSNVAFYSLEPEPTLLLNIMEESDVWMEEDLEPLTVPGYSLKPKSPLYQRKIVDPLGISSGFDTQGSGSSKETLSEMFPHGSGNLLSENFNPVWFLLDRHQHSSFDNLKLGLQRLKMEVERSEQAPVEFMRDNLDAFLQCYDTLSDVNELLLRNESESQGGSLTDTLEELLKESTERADSLFCDVLRCKERADATRNALHVLQRHRFLFGLPKSIDRNIKNGDYDLLASDYERAKQYFAQTKVKLFRQVLEEAENKLRKFREDLKKKLQTLPSTLEEQKRTIKYLLDLDCEGDPAWDCITNMHGWLRKLLFNCKEEFQHQDPSSGDHTPQLPFTIAAEPSVPSGSESLPRGHSRTTSDLSFLSTGSSQSATPAPTSRAAEGRATKEWQSGTRDMNRPNRILFVEELTCLIEENLLDFWRLGQAYQSGALFQGATLSSDVQEQLVDSCRRNGVRFESMVVEIIDIWADMMNCSFYQDEYDTLPRHKRERLGEWIPFDDSLQDASGAWLPLTVREIRECVSSLLTLSLPERAAEMIQQLAQNVRKICSEIMFYRTARDIEVLPEREDWRVHAEEGGIITSLPILFENMVVEVLLTLKEIVIENHPGETDDHRQPLLEASVKSFESLLDHFFSCIEYLAFQQEDDQHEETLHLASHGKLDTTGSSHSDEAESNPPTTDERLLMIMSNLSFVECQVIPRLFDCFVSHGYPHCQYLRMGALDQLTELDDRVFVKYITRKSESVVGIVEQGTMTGYFDWEQCRPPEGVRNYVKDILLNLVIVHAEVYAVSPQIVERVLSRLTELLSAEMMKVLGKVETFSNDGILHAFIEITVLERALQPFITETSRKTFERCKATLAQLDGAGSESVDSIADEFLRINRLQLRCFEFTGPDEEAEC